LIDSPDAVVTRGSTFDNARFLAAGFIERITARFEGRTLGRQELYAEIVEETPGALWTRALIERQRLPKDGKPREYAEIVIGVDPPARSGAKADECGIVAVGRTAPGIIHVLADLTSQGETPGEWSARVVATFRQFAANRVVAEINNGGEMVTQVLRQNDPNVPVRTVTATRGKFLRAEPIAAAYERGVVFHLGVFDKLEDQLCSLTSDFDARASGYSPDRADALVWAIADLISPRGATPSDMLQFYAREMNGA
jgi:phage terminase large subunit-like protein